jgi:hypothetical protein
MKNNGLAGFARFFAWALALIAFSQSASAKSFFDVSVAPESPRRTAFRSNDGYRVVSVYRFTNTGDAVGEVNGIGIDHPGLAMVAVEVGDTSYSSEYDLRAPQAWISFGRDIPIGPGESLTVTMRGLFIPGAKEVSAAIHGFSGKVGDMKFSLPEPASHAIVEELQTEGIGNTSALTAVSPTQQAVIGFSVIGDKERGYPVLVRAIGPGLKKLGVVGTLSDPYVKVFDKDGIVQSENDDWDAGLSEAFSQVGAFPLEKGSLDAAFLVWLTPGSYTAQVKGFGTGAGQVLIEIYQLPLNGGAKG